MLDYKSPTMCTQLWDFSGIDLKNITFHDVLMYMDVGATHEGCSCWRK